MIVVFPGHTHSNFAQLTMFVHVLSNGRSEFLLYSSISTPSFPIGYPGCIVTLN